MFEGLNLLHALIYGGHQDLVDKYHEGAVASEVAALIHYGTTVSSYEFNKLSCGFRWWINVTEWTMVTNRTFACLVYSPFVWWIRFMY